MKLVTAYRANKILYNFLASNKLIGASVVLPANICPDVVETLRLAKMQLHFVDIAPDTLCMNQQMALEFAQDIQVLLFVHTYGLEQDFDEFYEEVRKVNQEIVIIDDKCLCLPELQLESSAADLVLYSMGPKKQVEMGKGAIGYIADRWQYEEVKVEENNGILENCSYVLDEKALHDRMDAIIAHKEKLNAIYHTHLPKSIQFPEQFQHWRFNIWIESVDNRERILQNLFGGGYFASTHYKPIQSTAEFLPIMGETAMVAPDGETNGRGLSQKLYDHVINLFNDQYYTEQQALETCRIINENI